MEPFITFTGSAVPLRRANVDTDQIMPKQFLKRVERSGYGEFLFWEWRQANTDFILDRPAYRNATILVAGPNFGSGSSREHAPWGLQDWGFRVILAPSFADIFYNNCTKIGLLPVRLTDSEIGNIMQQCEADPNNSYTVDLEEQTVSGPSEEYRFEIDPYIQWRLLHGLDDIELTLAHSQAIASFEEARPTFLPTLQPKLKIRS